MNEQQEKQPENSPSEENPQRDEKGRFVRGWRGGPGYPLGQPHFHTDFDLVVKEVAELNKISVSEARIVLIRKAYAEAKDGNFSFYKDILDRYYGKPPDSVDITTAGEKINPIEELHKLIQNDLSRFRSQ